MLKKDFNDLSIVDSNGVIQYADFAVPEFFCCKPEEIIGKKFTQIYSNIDENTSTFMRAIRSGERFIDYEQELETPIGRIVKQREDIYLMKSDGRVVGSVEFAVYDTEKDLILHESQNKKQQDSEIYTIDSIIGESPEINLVKSKIRKVADEEAPVLIMGATGTGKELTAKVIHSCSKRRNHPFVYLNCGALPENLLESILFGTKKGSFTDAEEKEGLFQIADKGTLFLDEIDSMPLSIQPKILRAIEEKSVRPIGAYDEVYLDVRIIASSNHTAGELLHSNMVRNDLFFRLSVIQMFLPPLSERKGDILLLVNHYIKKFSRDFRKDITVSDDARTAFMQYSWPGNIRELKNMLEGFFASVSEGCITASYINSHHPAYPSSFRRPASEAKIADDFRRSGKTLPEYLEDYEKARISELISDKHFTPSEAAEALGLSLPTLKNKMAKYHI